MTEATLEISRAKVQKRALTKSDRNAWAAYVRRRWLTHTLTSIQRVWGLNEHQARSVLYGHVSQSTIDIIKDHRNGGLLLALDVLCIRFSVSLDQLAARIEERAEHERDHREAEAKRWRRARRSVAIAESVSAGEEA